MKIAKLLVIALCSFCIPFETKVSNVDVKELNSTFNDIKYASSSNETSNLYSSSIDTSDCVQSGKTYVTNPEIKVYCSYGSKRFQLANYKAVNITTRPDGETRANYIATYVYTSSTPLIKTYAATVNLGHLEGIGCSFETTESVNIEASIETEIGTGAEAFGFEAKAGIKTFFNEAAGYGSGYSFGIEYDLYGERLELNSGYSIKKTTNYYEFLTVVYIAEYSKNWAWFKTYYKWEDYSCYGYVTNSIACDSYELVEA